MRQTSDGVEDAVHRMHSRFLRMLEQHFVATDQSNPQSPLSQ